jgi:hypothetical protein
MLRTFAVRFCIVLSLAAPASAQNNRSAVSVNGSDLNSCTPASPCRSFTAALAHTNPGGEVIALDSGGYGPFSVTQDVTVAGAPGVYAALTVSSGNGIDVNAPNTSVKINNLRISMLNATGIGINATAFTYLMIDNCLINGGQSGIWISGPYYSRTVIADTIVRTTANIGFFCQSSAAILRSRAEGCANYGLYAETRALQDTWVTAVDFAAIGGHGYGVQAFGGFANRTVDITLDRAVVSGNTGDGISALGSAGAATVIRVGNSVVTDNDGYGMHQSGTAAILSMQNNIAGPVPTGGTITPLPTY